MSFSHDTGEREHVREDGLVTLSLLGFAVALVLMGWCLFGHQRPNMPHATVIEDVSVVAR